MVASALDPYSLLIADDDEACLDTLREAFEPEGYDTHLANSGRMAIRVVREHRIHVAILDMQMPGLTGLEIISLIHDMLDPPIPCVLMSGDATKELKMKALAAHVYSLIPKPLNLIIMREIVAEILREYYA